MAYSNHVGWGHTWIRNGRTGDVRCSCGLKLPMTSTKSLPKDQRGQLNCALAMDLLADHGMIRSTEDFRQTELEYESPSIAAERNMREGKPTFIGLDDDD